MAVGLAACALPLADHVGYELGELVALWLGLAAPVLGLSAARLEDPRSPRPARALGRALLGALAAVALPLALALLNGWRRPACDPLGALPLYLALAGPSASLGALLGVAAGFTLPSRAGLPIAAVWLATLAASLAPVLRGPQVFVFHHLGGMYPGPLYDEAVGLTPALLAFRACTLSWAATCAGVALWRGGVRGGRRLGLTSAVAALWLSSTAERFHWTASSGGVARALGAAVETPHLRLYLPREMPESERARFAQAAEADARAVRRFFGEPVGRGRIEVFVYRSPEEKRVLVGAAETSFTKPWLRQIHLNAAAIPHPILRHELVHAVGADVSGGPFGVPGRFGGLLPEMALIEGVAVAGDWPPGELTVHEEARALLALGLLPRLERLFVPGAFYAESGPRAYTAAGSFARFLHDRRGADWLAELYAGHRRLERLDDLAGEHRAFLAAMPPSARALALARQRFSSPGIVHRRCPHEVALLAGRARTTKDPDRAAALWQACAALDPEDPSNLALAARGLESAGQFDAARALRARALSSPAASEPLQAQLLTAEGDAAWKRGELEAAAQAYREASARVQPEAAERALLLRREALADAPSWPALQPLLLEADTSSPVRERLTQLDGTRPRDGRFAYLLARLAKNRGDDPEAARRAREATARGLPSAAFVQEALRIEGLASWRLGDREGARRAFVALGDGASPGRALEAQRWLELLGE